MSGRSMATVSEKIDHLFKSVRRPDGREFTYDDVEQGTGSRISRSYIWKLRHGRNRNPSLDVIEAMSEFWGVLPEFFFDQAVLDDATGSDVAAVAELLRDPAARAVAERIHGLSPQSLQTVMDLEDSLRAIEVADGEQVTLSTTR